MKQSNRDQMASALSRLIRGIALGILGRQCLGRRIDNTGQLTREVAAWGTERNTAKAKVNWRFRIADARIKSRKLYPSIER